VVPSAATLVGPPSSPSGHGVTGVSLAWSAVHTRSGVSGRSRMTTPVASATAEPSAPAVHSRAPSLMPFEPYGPGPSWFSTAALTSSRGTSLNVGIR
jgi:hypothetical protein